MKETLKNTLDKPIVLVGMMGVGKSRLGQALAHALEIEFFDSDALVEERAGRSIPEVFEEFGETKFRQAERNAIFDLLEKGPCVIATGGGAVTTPETLKAIKDRAVSVWLQADLKTIMARVAENEDRPLLQTEDPEGTLKGLMQARESLYAQADIHFDTSLGEPNKLTKALIKSLCEYCNVG